MYYVYWYLEGELHIECCGNSTKTDAGWEKTSAGWAWRCLMAYLPNRAWMVYEKSEVC